MAIAEKLSPLLLIKFSNGGRIMAELRQNADWREAEHPRKENGEFACKTDGASNNKSTEPDVEQNERKWTAERKYPAIPKAQGFNRSNTKSHLAHAKEMGLNEKQYIKAAEEFFNGREGTMYRSASGKYFKYDEKRNVVCICNVGGAIHSFYQYKTKKCF